MCKSGCMLSFAHLFEAEYIDLSWEWVLTLLGIILNKVYLSERVLMVILPVIAVMLQMLDCLTQRRHGF